MMFCEDSECATDVDCFQTGCSGEICAAVDVASTCEWTSDLACYVAPTTSCGCFEGLCGWDPTDALAECLESPLCEEGETRPAGDDCNECFCDESGNWLCTERACSEPVCEPGEIGGECDECSCDEDGFWLCTDVECAECEPGATGGECGECICDDSGYWLCEGDCESACVAGETIPAPDGCNTCSCDADGGWSCTEMACASECTTDDQCFQTGCSGQLCASTEIATTCEWLPEYACFSESTTSCGCFEGICQWNATAELDECLGFD